MGWNILSQFLKKCFSSQRFIRLNDNFLIIRFVSYPILEHLMICSGISDPKLA
jgi:hypothetical protein